MKVSKGPHIYVGSQRGLRQKGGGPKLCSNRPNPTRARRAKLGAIFSEKPLNMFITNIN